MELKLRKNTQKANIMEFVEKFGYITSWDAYSELGITQLGARIFELEKLGVKFIREEQTSLNRLGKKVKYVKYILVK